MGVKNRVISGIARHDDPALATASMVPILTMWSRPIVTEIDVIHEGRDRAFRLRSRTAHRRIAKI